MNCETDFVARNVKFQQLVKEAALATLAHHQNKQASPASYTKVLESGRVTMPEHSEKGLTHSLSLTCSLPDYRASWVQSSCPS